MSLKIDIEKISDRKREEIVKDLTIVIKNESNITPDKKVEAYELDTNDMLYLPFAYAVKKGYKRPLRKDFPSMNAKFAGELYDEQQIVKDEGIKFLTKTGSVIISGYTGFGKSPLAINFACSIKLRTLIIVNRVFLLQQWKEEIEQFAPTASVQILTTKSKKINCDICIMNAVNIPKMGTSFFKDISLVIVDELHLVLAETLSKSLQFVTPRYLIGLSATAYRLDKLNDLIELYFGKNRIIRELKREHIVYKVNTGIVIPIEILESTKKADYGAILKCQSESEERNQLIIDILVHFKDNIFLVMCKRVTQARYLFKKLKALGESVDNLIGDKQDFDKNVRILIGIHQKTGVAFNWPQANALLLASSIKNFFIQSVGRVFRRKNTIPIIFDLLDKNAILMSHFKVRKEVYDDVGGIIKNFNKEFPEFFKSNCACSRVDKI